MLIFGASECVNVRSLSKPYIFYKNHYRANAFTTAYLVSAANENNMFIDFTFTFVWTLLFQSLTYRCIEIKCRLLKNFRVFWIVVLIASYFGIVFTCLYQWNRFEARPTVISLERDFRNWNVTLPAMTVCYGDKANETKAAEFIEKLVDLSSKWK